jgi:hypothetical protein
MGAYGDSPIKGATTMSILDKVKGAVSAVTGGAATVTLEHTGSFAAGGTLQVKVSATAKGNEVKVNGVYVDLQGKGKSTIGQVTGAVLANKTHALKIAEGCTLAANESKTFEGTITVPADLDANLDWEIRGRLDTFGNDPDSGFKDIR